MGVVDVVLVRLLIQEIKHVLDGEGQCTPTVSCAEDGLKQVIHEFLEGALVGEGRKEEHEVRSRERMLNSGTPLKTGHVCGSEPGVIEKRGPFNIG